MYTVTTMVTTETVCFDKESGQVYTEQTCKAGPSIPDWLLKSRGSIKQVTNFVNIGPGCSSLRAMSRRCIVFNAFNLTPEAIEALPVHLAQRVWQEITRE